MYKKYRYRYKNYIRNIDCGMLNRYSEYNNEDDSNCIKNGDIGVYSDWLRQWERQLCYSGGMYSMCESESLTAID